MVTNINYEELVDERNQLVEKILERFSSWDGNLGSGFQIIELNQEDIDRLDTLGLQLSRTPLARDEEYVEKLKRIVDEQKRLIQALNNEKENLLQNMQQLNKKDQVIKSYIAASKKPVFIDKDVK